MKLSVVIPSFNDKADLEKCLESLGSQTIRDFEIIVVDDGSTDGTSNMLSGLTKVISNFQFIQASHVGAGGARNLGAQKAKGDILVFVDSDMTFDRFFLEKLVRPITAGEKGTFSKEEFVSNWENIWSRCWNINEGWEEKRRHPKYYPDSQPVFRAILKSEFDRVGGFTPGGYDDDWSLSKKLGYLAKSAPGAIFYHKNPSRLSEIFKHAKWVAKRKYKFGGFGLFASLLRASFPISLTLGIYKSVLSGVFEYIVFKIVYDAGIFFGILEFIVTKKGYK